MKVLKRLGFVGIIQIVCFILGALISFGILKAGRMFSFKKEIFWTIYWYVNLMFLSNVLFSNKFAKGKAQEVIFFLASVAVISNLLSYILFTIIKCSFNFSKIDWLGCLDEVVSVSPLYYGLVFLFMILLIFLFVKFINPNLLNFMKSGLRGKGKLKQVDSNLENSRWMNKNERETLFKKYKFSGMKEVKKDGIPVMAKLDNKGKDMEVLVNSPCHALVIGSTGSGKTTTFVNPMIQLLAASSAGSSMIITDPKGELFNLHSKFLVKRGYDVKVVDLRDPYSSYRWNPLDSIWDTYQLYLNAHKQAYARTGDPEKSGLKLVQPIEMFTPGEKWFEFDGKGYAEYSKLIEAIKVYQKKQYDEVYEDLNDLVSVLIPIENEKDPMWEKGARSITLAVLLAMLEDSEDESLGMTKEKYNFFNLAKILQNSTNDYIDLRNYFAGRNVLSKAYSLSKQVCDCAEQTRASYMSIVYEKLTMFNDDGICALTSSSDFSSAGLADHPTALFLKIPDEKDTRHNLAAIFILNIYKTLIKVASATEELSLPRNVYFIMDEFGNMPKIEKFDKFITVGRSRKIWFTMIVQSYSQLNNVYGETVADIIKGNCGIKMFIGSNDMNTCKEYSELCGNITVITTSTSSSSQSKDVNMSNQTQVRPLIYPSELQRLNKPGDIGHSIVVTFGNYPLKTYFTPSFKVPLYEIGKMDISELNERYFDSNQIFYNAKVRNDKVISAMKAKEEEKGFAGMKVNNEAQETKEEKPEETKPEEVKHEQSLEEQLLEGWVKFKEEHEDATLDLFYQSMIKKKPGRRPKKTETEESAA